eukprot:286213_1
MGRGGDQIRSYAAAVAASFPTEVVKGLPYAAVAAPAAVGRSGGLPLPMEMEKGGQQAANTAQAQAQAKATNDGDTAGVDLVIKGIALTLADIAAKNDAELAAAPVGTGPPLTVFHALTPPSVSIGAYLNRIVSYTHWS